MSRVPATPVSLPAPKSSLQYDLFTTFLGNAADLSNTIELWDAVPRYAYGARRQSDHRASGDQPQVYQHTFKWQPQPKAHNPPLTCDLTITPARVLTDAGWIDVFPSADEELVEEVLRKLFADQQYGLHDPQAGRSYVRFSLHTIRRELAARGKTRSIPQIKQALDILNKATVKVTAHDASGKARPLCQGPIIPHLFSRGEIANPDTTLWAAQLHPLITSAIEKLTYRQFNYKVLMSLTSPLARWLLKRLSHDYLNASLVDPYHVLMSSIARDSGLLQHSRTSADIKTLEAAHRRQIRPDALLRLRRRNQGRQRAREQQRRPPLRNQPARSLARAPRHPPAQARSCPPPHRRRRPVDTACNPRPARCQRRHRVATITLRRSEGLSLLADAACRSQEMQGAIDSRRSVQSVSPAVTAGSPDGRHSVQWTQDRRPGQSDTGCNNPIDSGLRRVARGRR